MKMTKKKQSASFRPAKPIRVSAESILNKPVSKMQKAVLARIAKRQAAQFRRTKKVLVAARIDREVYDWLMRYGKGYSTRINGILRAVMERNP
jgi:uncharacterized protein (DUF4415 family)